LVPVVQVWATQWGTGELTCETAVPERVVVAADQSWVRIPNAGLALRWPAGGHAQRLGALWSSGPSELRPAQAAIVVSALTADVAGQALNDLERRLASAVVPVSDGDAALEAAMGAGLGPWSGAAICCVFQRGPGDVDKPLLWIATVPRTRASRGDTSHERVSHRPLAPCLASAVADQQVKAFAGLQGTKVSLGQLVGLQPGDVLVLDHRLDAPVPIWCMDPASSKPLGALAGSPAHYWGRLAQALEQRAVVLSGASTSSDLTMSSSNRVPRVEWIDLPTADPLAVGSGPALEPTSNPLLQVRATVQVLLGEASLTVGELATARAGQVLALDRPVDGLVDLVLNGHVVARGQLVAVDDHFAVRLTETPPPLLSPGTPTES
jgi:flagellar motor switch protein FliN/FliY